MSKRLRRTGTLSFDGKHIRIKSRVSSAFFHVDFEHHIYFI
jgi:hypothetical protein